MYLVESSGIMKKNFIALFTITVILMIGLFVLATFHQYNPSINKIGIVTTIIILSIVLFILVVLLIIHAKKNIYNCTNIKNNENTITLTSISVFGIIILCLISNSISQMLFEKRTNMMINDANKLISIVENLNKKNYIFMLDSIKNNKLTISPFGNNYKKNSYITTFNKTYDICLTDGKYSIIKNINTRELELVKDNMCNYEITDKDVPLFIKERLFEKYNITFDIYDCKRNYDYDSVFNNKTGVTCEIKYNDKKYSATLYDKKFELIDSYIGGNNEK